MISRIALLALLAVVPRVCAAADPRYPDWPCAQAKVPEISLAQVWAGPPLSQGGFHRVELLDLAEQPRGGARRLFQGVVDFAADMSPTARQLNGSLAAVGKGAIGRIGVALEHAPKVCRD